jgi:indole-3-glycerol phosphate synthase
VTILDEIIVNKRKEVERLYDNPPSGKKVQNPHSFMRALRESPFSVIAEIKRRSPSRGSLATIPDPQLLAKTYEEGNARAISVLTDTDYFGGSPKDLQQVAGTVSIPILRKDFIIDPIQINETAEMGASALLLIVAVLGKETAKFIQKTKDAGLDSLVEVHNKEELDIALEAGAGIIGVNNRNLHTFETSLAISEELSVSIPKGIVSISESGIHTKKEAEQMRSWGYRGILVGRALVESPDPKNHLGELYGTV